MQDTACSHACNIHGWRTFGRFGAQTVERSVRRTAGSALKTYMVASSPELCIASNYKKTIEGADGKKVDLCNVQRAACAVIPHATSPTGRG
jgi:hypothetical protein